MSIEDEIRLLETAIDLQSVRGDAFRSMTTASRHMRAAAGFLENVTDERAQRAMRLLLDAVRELADIEVPR